MKDINLLGMGMGRIFLAITAISVLALPAQAEKASRDVAELLGTALAAEEPCELAYHKASVAALISQNISAGDKRFAKRVEYFTHMRSGAVDKMLDDSKIPYCAQIKRTAKLYGLIKE